MSMSGFNARVLLGSLNSRTAFISIKLPNANGHIASDSVVTMSSTANLTTCLDGRAVLYSDYVIDALTQDRGRGG
jgi:hypothetical protein